jgi:hypothetical protein
MVNAGPGVKNPGLDGPAAKGRPVSLLWLGVWSRFRWKLQPKVASRPASAQHGLKDSGVMRRSTAR